MAQICRMEDEIPKGLLPAISKRGTIRPIKEPETYQGHGCVRNSFILRRQNKIQKIRQ